MPADPNSALVGKLRKVRLFLCDVDGVLTDGRVLFGEGREYKSFHIQDGLGMLLLQKCGIKVGWISNRPSAVTEQRGKELRVDFLFQAKGSKTEFAEEILKITGLNWEEVCYVGDDIVDLCLLKRVGVAVAVANAIPEAKALADYTTAMHGGHGAVREVATLILQAQNRWAELIKDYTG